MTNDFKNKQSSGARPPRLSPEEYAAKKKAEKDAVYQMIDDTATEIVSDPDKFRAYLDYIATRCTWVMNPRYGYGFDFLIDRDTLDKARNTTLEDRIND